MQYWSLPGWEYAFYVVFESAEMLLREYEQHLNRNSNITSIWNVLH